MADDVAQLRAQLAEITAERDRLVFGGALDPAIAAAGVRPQYRAAVKALFIRNGKLELVDGGVLCSGTTVADAVRAWAATAEGRAFIGPGDAASGGRSAPTAKKRSEMTRAEKGAYIGEHGLEAFEKLPR